MNQLELHKKIDEVIQRNPANVKKEEVFSIISVNDDVKRYFFFKANKNWIDWLWNNGFLEVIKEKPEISTSYGYRTPEINYLASMAKEVPEKVTQIILDKNTATTKDKFNPELIDQFLRMCDDLPTEQLSLVIPKIHDQKWVRLMSKFSHFGFEYERMFKILSDTKDYKNGLLLAETVLDIHEKEDFKKSTLGFSTDNPFYLNDLSYTKVFEFLDNIPEQYTEEALKVVTKSMSKIVLLGDISEKDSTFPINETYHLFDVDFFSLKLGERRHLSPRDDVKELTATMKVLVDKLIGEKCTDKTFVRKIYNQYIKILPESRALWRFRLYVLSLCPEIFSEELKDSFFKLFSVQNYYDIISGTEYEEALKRGFPFLSEEDKRDYVKKVIEYFKKHAEKDVKEDQPWHMRYGADLLSMIIGELTQPEKKQIEKEGFKLNPDHKPEPSVIGPTMASIVQPQGPITQEEFGKLSIEEISKQLRDELSPKKLKEKYERIDEFNKPHNAEGVGNLLQNDIPKRLQGYIDNAELFFEREILDQHYTYSFFRGIETVIKNNRSLAEEINWDGFIKLCENIKNSGLKEPFDEKQRDRGSFDGWLSNWTSVHDAMTDALQNLIKEEQNYKTIINFDKYRDRFFEIISYLLEYPDPIPKDEEPETASMTSGGPDNKQQVSDPFTMAVNSVRGRAFQTFMFFIYPDGRNPNNKNKVIIKEDAKKLYEKVLEKENTKALMFMFGHYLPSFYFRDIKWMQGLLPKIFPREPEKKYLYLAAWEGYLANSLYQEIFFDTNFQELYKHSLSLDIDDSGRRYFRDPDDGIAIHLALAFVHYEEFGFEHPLFKLFWAKEDSELHAQFVSFIGRSFISGNNAATNEFLKKDPIGKQRIKELWDWLLSSKEDKKLFTAFGFWIDTEKNIFDLTWLAGHLRKTFEKSKGAIDWDYGLTKNVIELSKIAPKDMIAVARLHFLEGQVRNHEKNIPFRIENEWMEAFKILYSNPESKEEVYTLIDDLIREGGGSFWGLKNILKDEDK